MSMFHTDGVLFKNVFGTEEMREIVCEERFIERFLEVEAALARAEARAGLVPEQAAEEITEKASLDYVDFDDIEQNVADIHLFTMAIITAWKDQVGDAGEYIHWGATSQDISDMALLLQLREGCDVIRRDLEEIKVTLADLAEEYAETPMIGRTHHVHATPITFGLKVATWLDELDRHLERLDELRERVFVIQFFGATGTLASVGDPGLEVQEHLADELDLAVPDAAWYTARDRFAELLSALAMMAGLFGRIAQQVLLLNRPEFQEVHEPIPEGEVGSSTMPHKRNPVKSEETLALSRLVRGNAAIMNQLLLGFDERDASAWFAEFAIVPETVLYVSRMLAYTREILDGLVVNPDEMASNLELYGSLVTSEAVMMELADAVGRQTAHDIVYESAMRAIHEDVSFEECLREDERVTGALTDAEIERVTDPTAYTGLADRIATAVVGRSRQ